MTQAYDTSNQMTLSRPRYSQALPVLISIPNVTVNVSGAGLRPRVRRRRRLRREFRIAGYALLAILPASMAFVALAGERLPTLAAGARVERKAGPAEPDVMKPVVISLAPLEPIIHVQRGAEAPVVLPGYLWPADKSEEPSDGGH